MNVTRSIVGGLVAGGLVLGLGSAATADPGGYDDHYGLEADQEDEFEANKGSNVAAYNAANWSTVHANRTVAVSDDDTSFRGVINVFG